MSTVSYVKNLQSFCISCRTFFKLVFNCYRFRGHLHLLYGSRDRGSFWHRNPLFDTDRPNRVLIQSLVSPDEVTGVLKVPHFGSQTYLRPPYCKTEFHPPIYRGRYANLTHQFRLSATMIRDTIFILIWIPSAKTLRDFSSLRSHSRSQI